MLSATKPVAADIAWNQSRNTGGMALTPSARPAGRLGQENAGSNWGVTHWQYLRALTGGGHTLAGAPCTP
jgi:hypothetical protein